MKRTWLTHLAAGGIAFGIAWTLGVPGGTSRNAGAAPQDPVRDAFSAGAGAHRRATARSVRHSRCSAETCREAWDLIAQRRLGKAERRRLQWEIFNRWADVDLEAAIKAALAESWDGAFADRPETLLRGQVMLDRSEDVWRMIREKRFGLLGSALVMEAWSATLGAKDPELFLGYLPEMEGMTLRNSLHAMVEQVNSSQDARTIWDAIGRKANWSPAENELLGQIVVQLGGFFSVEDLRGMTEADEGPATPLAWRALLGKLAWNREAVDYGAELAAAPAPLQDELAFHLLSNLTPHPDIRTQLTMTALNHLVAHERWDYLARREAGWQARNLAGQMDASALAEWAANLPPREETTEMFHHGVEPLIQQDRETAWEWMSGLEAGRWRDRAFAEYSQQSLHRFRDPDASRAALDQIQDSAIRETAETRRREWEESTGGASR